MNITFSNVSFKYNIKPILNNVNFTFNADKKIGLVGTNGSGKSTILKLISNIEKPSNGEIIISNNIKINYLEQDPIFPNDISIINLFNNLEDINEYEVKTILNKFKLTNYDAICNNLSGGEKKRLALALTLIKKCDILILDEPTNHLDIDMIMFLEKYLMKWNKGLILITHDRFFLDVICEQILELKNSNILTYNCNYTKYLELREVKERELQKDEQKHKKLLIQETAWASKQPKARTTKSKSRLDRFEELKEKTFTSDKEINFNSVDTRIGKKLIEIKDGCKSYDKILFNNFNLSLAKIDIIGFVGGNGCGKSTLFKIIMGKEQLDSGILELGETLKIGFLQQELDINDSDITVMKYLKDIANEVETIDGVKSVSTILNQFGFDKSQHHTQIKFLSGGEKRRLQLVKVLIQNPNLLILDEPTNDLDIFTLDALENYLVDFIGPVLIVSHDRYLLDNICTRICIFENNNITISNQTYSEYLNNSVSLSNKEKKDTRVAKVKMSSKDRNLLESLDLELPILEDKINNYKKELSLLSTEYTKIMELTNLIEELSSEIDDKTTKYLELLELKELLS